MRYPQNVRRVFSDELMEYDERGHIVPTDQSYIIKGYPLLIGSSNWLRARERLGLENRQKISLDKL